MHGIEPYAYLKTLFMKLPTAGKVEDMEGAVAERSNERRARGRLALVRKYKAVGDGAVTK